MTRHIVICDLLYGDSGKGLMTDALARLHSAKLVVRFSGGPQCGHNVITPGGKHHCFSQFGAGTFAGARTHLSKHMLIEPWALLNEAKELGNIPLEGMTIEEGCPVITPYHWLLNRIRELSRGTNRHGSCGFGVGEARSDQIAGRTVMTAEDIARDRVMVKARAIKEEHWDEAKELSRSCHAANRLYTEYVAEPEWAMVLKYNYLAGQIVPAEYLDGELKDGTTIFEGSQGALLDETYGFPPYNTWTDTTFRNADALLCRAAQDPAKAEHIGVLRCYSTRHGAGPFVTEDKTMQPCPGEHNVTNPWQGDFRLGLFDPVAARYAIKCSGRVDKLALTHLDRFKEGFVPVPQAYEKDGKEVMDLKPGVTAAELFQMRPTRWSRVPAQFMPAAVETLLNKPVGYESWGPTADDVMPMVEA